MCVASVSYKCCKSISGCCICWNVCTRMLQTSVSNVLPVFSDVCCKCVCLDVAYVSHICFKCFIWMLRMCYNGFQVFLCFLQVFQVHVSSVSSVFVCILQVLYLVRYFKSRLSVASLSSSSAASPWCLSLPFVALHHSQTAEGGAAGWQRERERTLSPSVTQAGNVSVPSIFLLRRMVRCDCSVGGLRRQPTVRLAEIRPDSLLALDVLAL
jgi:hypothetical protein